MTKLTFYTDSEFSQLRKWQDSLADNAAAQLMLLPGLTEEINGWTSIPKNIPRNYPNEVQDFFEFFKPTEVGMEPIRIKAAQDFFQKYQKIYLAVLGFYSLPYTYAFSDGTQVLVRSKRIMDDPGKRLSETAMFVMEAFSKGTFSSREESYLIFAKVRLIHSFSRLFILKYGKDWDSLKWGNPINQEDLLGTNLAFSLIVIRGMRKLGISVSGKEAEDLLYYWKWIGHFLGLNTYYWPDTPKEAYELEKLISKRHVAPSESGQKLIASLLRYYVEASRGKMSKAMTESLISFLVGKGISRALGIVQKVYLPNGLLNLIIKLNFFLESGSVKDNRNPLLNSSITPFPAKTEIRLPVFT